MLMCLKSFCAYFHRLAFFIKGWFLQVLGSTHAIVWALSWPLGSPTIFQTPSKGPTAELLYHLQTIPVLYHHL